MFYLIKEVLEECSAEELQTFGNQYVAVLTPEEWSEKQSIFDMVLILK